MLIIIIPVIIFIIIVFIAVIYKKWKMSPPEETPHSPPEEILNPENMSVLEFNQIPPIKISKFSIDQIRKITPEQLAIYYL